VQHGPFQEWIAPDGKLWSAFYREPGRYLIRFPGLADFTVSKDGATVGAYPVPDVSRQTLEHLYLNQVLPLALSRQFRLVLHAGAVDIAGFAVAFLGISGRGKSTLTASFATNGFRFLTDDGLLLEESADDYLARPSHPSIRLWDDSRTELLTAASETALPLDYTPKARLLANNQLAFCDEARPLKALYFLGEGLVGTVTIQPIVGREAMIELVRHSFLLDIEEREMMTHHFETLAEMAKRHMFFSLDYPRRYDLLSAVRERVIMHASGL
jgi:hypothetical protein